MAALSSLSCSMAFLLAACATQAIAQQVSVTAPLVSTNDSFYERFGINWGFRTSGPNGYMFFDSGGAAGGIPPFGGYDPSADARFGFGVRGNNSSAYFNLVAGQGSTRTIVSQSGSLTLMSGYPGSVQDVRMRPFVTGLIPVVGDMRTYPLDEKIARLREQGPINTSSAKSDDSELSLGKQNAASASSARAAASNSQSSAERGDISVAEIRRQQEAAGQRPDLELQELIDTARLAEARGLYGAARIRYQKAAALAEGELKQQLLGKLESLRGK